MKLYKYETHAHTSDVSICGKVDADQLVRLYKDAGYQGIVITDHYYREYFDRIEDKDWGEKVDTFLTGYNKARKQGAEVGLDVILGMEIRFDENFNDYLVYGINQSFLKENKELYKLTLRQFKELIKDYEMLVVQAHPFRVGMVPAEPSLIHGVEVYNAHPRHNSHNDMALAYAQKNNHYMLSGSDFHQAQDLARGGIIVAERITSSEDFVKVIKENRILELIRV